MGRIVHVTEVDGFLNHAGEVVEKITEDIWPSLKEDIRATKGFDVTGGMTLKVEESLALAKNKIDSYILSGLEKNNLYNSLVGENFLGTQIS